jgi:D-3-phosphoglycerate dehydrogenase
MTVVLDLDGVLTEHPRVLAQAASERFGIDLPERAFIDAAGLEIADEVRAWVYSDEGPAGHLEPAAGAAELVARLAAGTHVCIVTARSAACAPMTRAWLARHGFGELEIRFADDKPAVARNLRAACAIEDSERHARVYAAAGIPCLLLGEGPEIAGVTRVASLAEAVTAAAALAPDPTAGPDPRRQAAAAAGRLLAALAPDFTALQVTVNGLVGPDQLDVLIALALGEALGARGGPVAPEDARAAAAALGIRVAVHAGTDDPAVEPSISFDAAAEEAHHVRIAGTGDEFGVVEVDRYALGGALHGDVLITRHGDAPGVIGSVGTVLGRHHVNIAGMQVGRHHRGGEALMVLNVDDVIPPGAEAEIRAIPGLIAVYVVSLPR